MSADWQKITKCASCTSGDLEIIWNFVKEYNKSPMSYDPQLVLDMFYGFEKVLGLGLDKISLDENCLLTFNICF